jgi:hypothetical protein
MGVISVLGPLVLSEIALPETRGIVTSMHQVACISGIFLSGVIAYFLVLYIES